MKKFIKNLIYWGFPPKTFRDLQLDPLNGEICYPARQRFQIFKNKWAKPVKALDSFDCVGIRFSLDGSNSVRSRGGFRKNYSPKSGWA